VQHPNETSAQSTGTGTGQASGLSGGSSTITGGWSTTYYESSEFTHECFQFTTTADAPGNVETLTPTFVRIIGTPAYTQGPPAPYVYNVNREILDQEGSPISQVMFVDESYSPDPPSGTCTSLTVDARDDFSTEGGTFGPDFYTLPGNAANPCSSTSTQSFKVTLNGVVSNIQTTYAVTWQYSGVSVTCSAGCR
jgi:hypothetical protein